LQPWLWNREWDRTSGEDEMTTKICTTLCAVAVIAAGASSVSAQSRDSGRARLTGTFELEPGRGDDPQRAADSATRGFQDPQRDRVYRRLLTRLEPPATLSLDRHGDAITIASSLGERTTFDADGRAHTEQGPSGRAITTRAELNGDRLTVSTSGNRGSDYLVTFEPVQEVDGDGLRVSRRFDSDDLRGPVTVQSFYRRVSLEPRWDVYRAGADDRPGGGYFAAVPDGTRIVATLDTPLSTRSSHSGQPFSMTVRQPPELEGARIDGVVTQVNHSDAGRRSADLRVDFEALRPRRGPATDFDAMLESVRTPDGGTIRVDPEGGVKDVSGGSDERVQHGAIGAALGAVIGAIAGGGKGAAVGAVVGGAGGAILVDGHDQLDLQPGTELVLTAIVPPRGRAPQR
jgi:hypothetical protein